MRILAIFCGAFSFGVFLAQYLLPPDWLLPCGAAAFVLSAGWLFLPYPHGRRLLLLGAGFAIAMGWNWLFLRQTALPAEALSGETRTVVLRLCDYPEATAWGARMETEISGLPGRVVYYGDRDLLDLAPGQLLRSGVRFQYAGRIRDSETTAFTPNGVFLLAYSRGKATLPDADNPAEESLSGYVEGNPFSGSEGDLSGHAEGNLSGTAEGDPLFDGLASNPASPRWWPVRLGRAARERIQALFTGDAALYRDDDAAAFLCAILTGERSGLPEQVSADLSEAGLSHILAVSGMHCGFLAALALFLAGRHRRRFAAGITIPLLFFYAALTGNRPSVLRACVMLTFLLAAPLFRRESDAPTALCAALFLLLFRNPFAAKSLSLQLSFASVAGLLLVSPPLYRRLSGETDRRNTRKKPPPNSAAAFSRKLRRILAASVAASVGALAFTAPLSAYAFGVVSLAAPLSNLLCLWAAGGIFVLGFAATAVSFLSPFAGAVLAVPAGLLIRYLLTAARLLASLPGHAVYTANPFLWLWFLYLYLLFLTARFLCGGTRYVHAAALSLAGLLLVSALGRRLYRDALDAVVLDVGQGQSVVLASGRQCALTDCGSGNSWYDAGAIAARQLRTMGYRRLDYLLLTHYDADHVNGLAALLARMPVRVALLPEPSDEGGGQAGILRLLDSYGVRWRFVEDREELALGRSVLTVFPPVGGGADNDRGLSVLASAGDADLLLTGDMGQSSEMRLLSSYVLPDLEAFVAGHHGSKYATSAALLDTLKPEIVCVSVGSNSYGHPAPEMLERLRERGCPVYRTDTDGGLWLAFRPSKQAEP